LSSGLWAVHEGCEPFFDEGQELTDRGRERLVEDGDPTELQRDLRDVEVSGAFGVDSRFAMTVEQSERPAFNVVRITIDPERG
jgi:hypothetical protein